MKGYVYMMAARMTVGLVTLIVLKRSLFRKFGMELRGINVNKGSDAKSYFLWAPSRSIIEVHSVILICLVAETFAPGAENRCTTQNACKAQGA